jgi:hypothetical protein
MTLADILQVVDKLSLEDRRKLRAYLDASERQLAATPELDPEEWIRQMEAAAVAIREGFSDQEWAEIEGDMNEEYIEPVSDDLWKD